VLVLSDGADTSDTDLETTTGAVAEAEILLDVVALDQSGPPLDALAALAEAGGGQVINADRNALSETFSEEAALLARQVLVTAQVPAGVSDNEATLVVTLPTAKAPIVVQAFAVVRASGPASPEALAPPATNHGWTPPDWVMYAGVGAVGVGLVGLLTMMVPSGPAPMTVTERVSQYTAPPSRHGSSSPKMDTDQALASAKDAAAGLLRRNQSLEARISHRLDGAGSALKSSEWLLLHGAIFVLAGLVGLLLGRGNIVIGLVFMAFGVFGPWVYLGLRRTRRRKAFNMALPETLQLMSGSMTAGLSLAQSVDTIVREGAEPIASEFKRVLVETRLGVSLEDAFNGVAERFESKDFEWVVMAIKIQRQVGGNLAELLDTVAATMREREYMRRQVAALAAEGKLSAIVLGGLPPLFLLYLLLTKRDYVMPMFTEPIGWVMLIGLGVLLSIGVFWMSRLIKVEV
jgi:tight adherence protein B